MMNLTRTQMLVLNSTADDWENLEQIYRSVCLEYLPDISGSSPGSLCWRQGRFFIELSEVVDALQSVVEEGLMAVKSSDGKDVEDFRRDLSYLWRGWFKMTPEGRARLEAADAAGLYPGLWNASDEVKEG
jgi:hypothetical protein